MAEEPIIKKNGNKPDPFDPEIGETYVIAGRKLKLRPLNSIKLKRLFKRLEESLDDFASSSAGKKFSDIINLADERYFEMLQIIFSPDQFEFLTKQFVDENITFPMRKRIVEDCIRLNELEDFLSKIGIAIPAMSEKNKTG